VYQFRTVSKEALEADEEMQLVHTGACGVCSTLKDLVVFAEFEPNGTQSFEHAHQPCVAKGIISRDWAIECYRDMGFTTPCSELLHFRSLQGFYSCSFSCVAEMDLSHECYEVCEAKATDTVFNLGAGLNFYDNSSEALANLSLPPINEELIKQEEAWKQPKYDQTFLDNLASKKPTNAPERPAIDPFLDPNFSTWMDPEEVCAVKFQPPNNEYYSMETYASEKAAIDDGAIVTHQYACGLCSSLKDLIVYVAKPDLTTPVRKCALKSFISEEWALDCLQDLGFSEPCADIWLFNARNTRKRCMSICMLLMRSPNNLPDGSLNRCIACDEEMSGPYFKKGSARTRRDSGIISAISRPGPAVYPLVHKYPPTSTSKQSSKSMRDDKEVVQDRDEL